MKKRKWLLTLGLLAPSLLPGCSWWNLCVDNCATVPPGAQPAPNGTYVRRVQEVQAAKAEADDFVVYKYEWYLGGCELGPFGKYHLNEMIKRLPFVPFPILIQAHTLDGQLNEQRRCHIVQALALNGIPDAEQRVVIGFPEAEGLYGDEAPRIYAQMITEQTGFNLLQGGFGNNNFFSNFGFGNAGFGGGFGGGYGGLGGYGGFGNYGGYGGYPGGYGGFNQGGFGTGGYRGF